MVATAAEIASALSGRYGPIVMARGAEVRDVTTYGLTADISTAIRSVVLEHSNDRAVQRTAVFTVLPELLPGGTAFDTDVHVSVVFKLLVNGTFEDLPVGLFHWDRVTRERAPGGELWAVAASDPTMQLQEAIREDPYTIAAGTNYVTAIETLLTARGLRHNIPGAVHVTPIAFTWDPETPELEIVNGLLAGINYYPISADSEGVMVSRERVDPSTEVGDVLYASDGEPRLLIPPMVMEPDDTRWPNHLHVIVDDPARAPVSVTRVNDDPSSIVSTVAKGATTFRNLDGDRTPDTTVMQEIADFELRQWAGRARPATIRTHLDPRRGPYEFYRLSIQNYESDTLWRALGWSMALEPGARMTHRIVAAPAVTISDCGC